MAVDERKRHELHSQLAQMLGPEKAATLMELLPGARWVDVATKHDLARFATKEDLAQLATKFATKEDLAQLATKKELSDLESRLTSRIVTVNVISILATAGVVLAATRLG